MKALVKENRDRGFTFKETEKPVPGPGEVLIRVRAAAICGTDMHYYLWNDAAEGFSSKFNLQFPMIPGHECAGDVEEVGSGVTSIKKGDRVTLETHIPCGHCFNCMNDEPHNCQNMKIYGTSCDGCFAEYAVAPESIVFRLPDEVSYEDGALFEPAGVAMRAVERADLLPGDTVLVSGSGPIGLLTIQMLYASGAGKVIATDLDEYRLKLAKSLGAIAVNSAKENLADVIRRECAQRGGVDVIIETTGAAVVYQDLFSYLRNEGHIVTVGHPGKPVMINIMEAINLKGATMRGVFGRKIWGTWWKVASLVKNKKVDLCKVVTHRFALRDGNQAFEQVPKGSGKILFTDFS
ncbi:MAG: alcohol dehydrogenase catalytic domain-containing protein [Eubacterium sp.]|nr:alcohol dehydrogenase catalytic domain-containing protein [Eubacterium sp.]